MRTLYSVFIYLLTPLVLAFLALRGLRSPDYARRWGERFARFDAPEKTGGIVVHAVSMGEVNAASDLVRELARRYPDLPLCLTTFTPTGSDRVRALFGDSVFHVYAPFDLPGAVRRFYDRVQPRLVIVMETEIWLNLYHEAADRDIPLLIANARISDRSFGRYLRLKRFTSQALEQVTEIGARGEQDAQRLVALGANRERLQVSGNLKFDIRLPASLIEQAETIRLAWGTHRPVFIAGSTHEAEEQPVLAAFNGVLKKYPHALLVLVPRHPERFGRAAQLARASGLRVAKRSSGLACPRDCQCFLIDTMGELLQFYAASDVAFVGGSLDSTGGHNVLEPAALARAVVVGPNTVNFAEITQQLIDQQAAVRVQDEEQLETAIIRLFGDPELRDRMGQAGLALVKSGQGALERTLDMIGKQLTRVTG